MSPGRILSPTPSSPGPDINTEDTRNQSMDDTIDRYLIERDVPRCLGRQGLEEERPIQCYDQDVIVAEDINNGCEKPDIDEVSDQGPFIGTPGLNLDTESRKPEDFFNNFFDDRMFTIIANATNDYAHKKIRSLLEDRDAFQQLEHHSHNDACSVVDLERHECCRHKDIHCTFTCYVFGNETNSP